MAGATERESTPVVSARAILRHREEVAPGHHLLQLEAPSIAEVAVPGQFVHVRVAATHDPLLRRPLSVLRADREAGQVWLLSRIVGRGTEIIAQSQPGNTFDTIGPLGNGFPLPATDGTGHPSSQARVILVAGGVGVAPLIFLADRLRAEPGTFRVQGLYGAATASALAMWQELSGRCDEFTCSTDDGSAGEPGLVTDVLQRVLAANGAAPVRAQVYTCGPRPMMAAVARLCAAAGVPCWASLEQFMGCGIGACLGCVVPTRLDPLYQRVCKDGPVFDGADILWDEVPR